jgi:hypothetical protein
MEANDRFVSDYNAQAHRAHRERDDGRRSPEEELRRAFFSARFVRVLDSLG